MSSLKLSETPPPLTQPDAISFPPTAPVSREEQKIAALTIETPPFGGHPGIGTRVKKYPKALCHFVNFTKIVWAIPWTVIRTAIVVIGILPVALICYTIVKIVKATRAIFQDQSNETILATVPNSPPKSLHQTAVELERLKKLARQDPEIRRQYYEYYSNNVDTLFSNAGMSERIGQENVNPELVEFSRESYINMNLVYHFDGSGMVGQEIKFMHRNDDGTENLVTYQVQRYFENDQGLVGYGLVPIDPETAPPRLIFRGTNTSSYIDRNTGSSIALPSGLQADVAEMIGKQAYENQQREIVEWLENVTNSGEKKAFVSGHSLGGALTQRVAIDYPQYVGKVFTLNSPRLETEALKPYESYSQMNIKHVIMKGDTFVPRVGGGRTSQGRLITSGQEGRDEIFRFKGGGHTSKIIGDYCMRETEVSYQPISTSAYIARTRFWARIMNFIRPNIDFV